MKIKMLYILAIAFLMLGCDEKIESSASYLQSGKSFYQKGEYTKAQLELKNALQVDNNLSEAYYYLALIDEKNQHWSGMLGKLSRTIELNPNNNEARLKLAKLYLLSEKMEEAKLNIDWVIRKDPENQDAIALNGAIYLKNKEYTEALNEAEKVLNTNPEHVDSINLKVAVLIYREDYVTAEAILDKALETMPEELSLNLLKLQMHTKINDKLAIEQDYQNLISRFPTKYDFVFALSKFYVATQREEKALNLLTNLVEKNPDEVNPKLVLIDYYLKKDKKEAERLLNKFIAENISDTGLHMRLANLYLEQKNYELAKPPLNWIVKHHGKEDEGLTAKVLLAQLATKEGDYQKASGLIDQVLKESEDYYSALILKARLKMINGIYDEAINDLQSLLTVHTTSDEAMVLLGQAYLKRNFPELAEVNFRQALKINPGNLSAAMPVVMSMINDKDLNRAEQILEKALKIKPDQAAALQALGEVKLLKKDWKGLNALAELISTKPLGKGYSHYLKGKIDQGQKKYLDAIKKYELALSITPTISNALKNMLFCYEELKQRDKMFIYLDKFMQNNPNDPYPVILKGQLFNMGKDSEKALISFNHGIEKWPDVIQFYESIAQIYSSRNENSKVIDTYKIALVSQPDNNKLNVLLASVYESEGDYDNAVNIYQTLVDKSPDLDIAVNNLVSLLLDHYPGKESSVRALKLADRFKKSDQPYFLDTYGWALIHNGKYEEAIEVFKKVVIQKPDIPVFKYHLGYGYSKLSLNEQALSSLEQALKLGNKDNKFIERELTVRLIDEIKAKTHN